MRKLFVLGGAVAVLGLCISPAFANWFGDGSDGDVTISSDTYLTVPNKNGPFDGDMVVKNYNSLTIETGARLTTDQPCRGLLIYVRNDAVINGTLSMTARGAYADPMVAGASDNAAVSITGLRYPVIKQGETEILSAADFTGCGNGAVSAVANQPGINQNGKIFVIQRAGANGGAGGYLSGTGYQGHDPGDPGSNGAVGQSGGGAGGGVLLASTGTVTGGAGGAGTCFAGGSGGGGIASDGGSGTGNNGAGSGGPGGAGVKVSGGELYGACGGSGNLSGSAAGYCWSGGGGGEDGSGGTIILIVGGNLSGTGVIFAKGSQAVAAGTYSAAGGGSGGGNILALYAGSLSSLLIFDAGSVTNIGDSIPEYRYATGGGSGSIQIAQIDAAIIDDDTDDDGLLDSWEMQYFQSLNQEPDDDPDSDTKTNIEEYQRGTDPTIYDPPAVQSNWFGDGSDGDVTISSTTYLTVPNKVGSYDGDMLVKNYNSLTIEAGATLTTDQPGRGLLIYVRNNAVINGTLSMTARGAYTPNIAAEVSASGLRYPVMIQGQTETLSAPDFIGVGSGAIDAVANQPEIEGNGKVFTILREGASGGSSPGGPLDTVGASGTNGGAGQSGGGGEGGQYGGAYGGDGRAGTCFSGGSGGGGASSINAYSGTLYGGAGGDGRDDGGTAGGGAGNPGGSGDSGGGNGGNGTGGLMILIVGGELTIGENGVIEAKGEAGGNGTAGGGGSGGGNILILHAGAYTNNNPNGISTAGGNGGTGVRIGGFGGSGSIQIAQIDAATGDDDIDDDGLPDSWETQYFGDLNQGPNDNPDADLKTNFEEYQSGTDPTVYDAPAVQTNWFGDGSDGDVTISSTTYLAVPNKVGSYDGDMVVKNYNSLTIEAGATLTTDQPGRGLLIYVKNNALINGTLSMTAKGAYANPTVPGASDNSVVSISGLTYPVLITGQTDTWERATFSGTGAAAVSAVSNQPGITGNGKIFTIQRTGATGGSGAVEGSGGSGGSGAAGQTGGGGGSGGGSGYTGGNGSAGTCFSGGTGGACAGGHGQPWGGRGGDWNGDQRNAGGAGNPGGSGGPNGGTPGGNGTGGLLILVVGGDLTIGSSGSIRADGVAGGTSNPCSGCDYNFAGGGGSGGGNVLILYGGLLSFSGFITANGGSGGGGYYNGGAGGAGSVQISQIDRETPPPPPPPPEGVDQYTKLIIHSDTADGDTSFFDSSFQPHLILREGQVHHNTTKSKFGATSIRFDGSGDFLKLPDNPDWDFAVQDFTIDFWMNTLQTSNAKICGTGNGSGSISGADIWISINEPGFNLSVTYKGVNEHQHFLTSSSTVNDGNWHHIALVRTGNTLTLYINGISHASADMSGDPVIQNIGNFYEIGRYPGYPASYYEGYLDEFRISKGKARWNSNFLPPSSPYTEPIDNDLDGLPDGWETATFGSLSQSANEDYDGDGVTNVIEYKKGTDANNASDRPNPGIYYEYDALGRIKKIYRIPSR